VIDEGLMSYSIKHVATLPAPRDTVFRALLTPASLMVWFSQHARVEPTIGGAYGFWGKHTLDGAGSGAGQQRIIALESDSMLAYSWMIADVPTSVSIALRDAEQGTRVEITHALSNSLGWPRERHGMEDWWRLCVANLAAHLAGGFGLLLLDLSDPAPEVRHVIDIAAPPSVVFRALTDPKLVNQWFASTQAQIEPRVGGRYTLGWSYQVEERDVKGGPTVILEYEQDRRLVLDWPGWRGDGETIERISFTLEATENGTRLTFVHDGFRRVLDISDYSYGWVDHLTQLRGVSEANAVAT
jgi:uncharacterized protein YndB with AHSA1/START domain